MLTTGQLRKLPLAEAAHAFNAELDKADLADRWARQSRSRFLEEQDARLERCPYCPAADAPVFYRSTRNLPRLAAHMAREHLWAETT